MNTLKNIHYLDLPDKDLKNLDKSAGVYAANANITFKVLKFSDRELIVEVRQGKNPKDQYQDVAGLVDRGKKLFSHFYPDLDIHIHPKPYRRPPVDQVDPEWIQKRMNDQGIGIKHIQSVTGIDKSNISAWVNGTRPMSQPVRAMFWLLLEGE